MLIITAKYTTKGAEKLRFLLLFLILFFKKDFFSTLIVVEGFDSGLGTFANSNYKELGEIEISNFESSYFSSNSNDLTDELSTYDIIYVNWLDGKDYIQRNAYLLEDIIKYVNQRKAKDGSTEPLVVLGQSMGGVIARYALRDMENRNENHQTRLYVSHDAPHQGANVPKGIYTFMAHLTTLSPSYTNSLPVKMSDVKTLLNAPGTKQLLYYNTLHNDWQAELQAMGYPQKTRNVAISNASMCARNQGFTAGADLFSTQGEADPIGIVGLVKYTVLIKASPSQGTSDLVCDFRIYSRFRFFRATYTLVWDHFSTNNDSYRLPYDHYPGGRYDFPLKMDNGSELKPFNFIPVTSALDVGRGTTQLTESDHFRYYKVINPPTGDRAIPFHNFTTSFTLGSGQNESHISFDVMNGDWLAAELKGEPTTAPCYSLCGDDPLENLQIQGEFVICPNQSYLYTLPTVFTDYEWSLSNAYDLANLVYETKKNTITIKTLDTYEKGYITLKARYGYFSCGTARTVEKKIWVGVPVIEKPSPQPVNHPETFFTASGCDASSIWEWEKLSGPDFNWIVNSQGGFYPEKIVGTNRGY